MGKKFSGNYDIVRVVAFAMVMIQHYFVTCVRNNIEIPAYAAWIIGGGGAINFGIVGVGLFYLLSGSVLWRNNKRISWKDFYKKHLIKLFLPIWVSYTVFALVYYAKHGGLFDTTVWQIVFPMVGGNFFTVEIQRHLGFTTMNFVGEWFTSVIIILYLFYPLLRKGFTSRIRPLITLLISLSFLGNFFVDFLIYQEGHISLTLGFFYFWIGMYFEEYHEKITSKWISLLALISGLVIWAVNPSGIFKNPYLPNLPVILLLYLSSFSIIETRGWIRWMCRYSYIVYLVHHTFMNWLVPIVGSSDMGQVRIWILFFLMMLLFFSVGITENWMCDQIIAVYSKGGTRGRKETV